MCDEQHLWFVVHRSAAAFCTALVLLLSSFLTSEALAEIKTESQPICVLDQVDTPLNLPEVPPRPVREGRFEDLISDPQELLKTGGFDLKKISYALAYDRERRSTVRYLVFRYRGQVIGYTMLESLSASQVEVHVKVAHEAYEGRRLSTFFYMATLFIMAEHDMQKSYVSADEFLTPHAEKLWLRLMDMGLVRRNRDRYEVKPDRFFAHFPKWKGWAQKLPLIQKLKKKLERYLGLDSMPL